MGGVRMNSWKWQSFGGNVLAVRLHVSHQICDLPEKSQLERGWRRLVTVTGHGHRGFILATHCRIEGRSLTGDLPVRQIPDRRYQGQ
jgi:hypothetical protein